MPEDAERGRERDYRRRVSRSRSRSNSRSGRKREHAITKPEKDERGHKRRREASHSRSRSISPRRSRSRVREQRSRSRSPRRTRKLSPRSRSRDKAKHRKRRSHSRSRSRSYSSSSSDDDAKRRRKRKDKHRKRDRGDSRSRSRSRDRKERKREKREKKKHKKKEKGSSTAQWGQYGIINESNMHDKDAEFRAWLVEERKINPETMSKDATKKEFAKFIEDFNTATLPHEKFYNMDIYERRMNMLRNGELLPPSDDKYDPNADMKAHSSSHKRPVYEKDTYMSKEQLQELRRVQNERSQVGKMKLMGMDIGQNFGARMDGSMFDG